MDTLYVVGTPIGNLEDITLRALRLLREVSLIAAEDTRTARKLLARYDIATPLISYFEHNKLARLERVLAALEEGDVALISEAGMPGVSDPGYELIRAALAAGVEVVPIPGPSAVLTSLVVSGLPTDRFLYLGFLPRRRAERRRLLQSVAAEPGTLLLFEAPHRLRAALGDLLDILGDRPLAVCRELTKLHEEVWRGTIAGAVAHFAEHAPRGEFTLVVGGAEKGEEAAHWKAARVQEAVASLVADGVPQPAAIRVAARLSGWRKRDVYALVIEAEKSVGES
ncbi:MAG: 16S rRNA (cytidine(1402)-2'-O)-methyltransferase [Chloroflexi bacterium]|nr:16S rRNA (cytidine(1402)-2'-O)-methyltransferase [Chloroflexota bacterium]